MRLKLSSLFPYNMHLLFYCTLSISALILLVLMALFCIAFKRDLVSLLRFPLLNHIQIISCETFTVNIIIFSIVIWWSFIDRKSPSVSKTLLRILADLKNAVVWMVSILLLIFSFSSPPSNYNWYHPQLHVQQFISDLCKGPSICFFLLSFIFIPWSTKTTTLLESKFFFLVSYH